MVYPLMLILAALMLAAASLIFVLKDVLHIAVALSAVFLINSLIFLIMGQPILAVIQLLVMIGGVSTYLFVGVASAGYSKFKYTNRPLLALVAVIIFAALGYGAYASNTIAPQQSTVNFYSFGAIASTFGSTYTILALYSVAIMMFALAFGAIPLLNRLKAI